MGLRLVVPLPYATYRLGAAAAKSQARPQGGLATLPTHTWFGLLDAMWLTKFILRNIVCGMPCLPLSDMAETSGTESVDFVGSFTHFNNFPELQLFWNQAEPSPEPS